MRVGARSPLEDKIGGFVGQKVQYVDVDVELVLFLILHTSGEGQEAGQWFAPSAAVSFEGLGQLFLMIWHSDRTEGSTADVLGDGHCKRTKTMAGETDKTGRLAEAEWHAGKTYSLVNSIAATGIRLADGPESVLAHMKCSCTGISKWQSLSKACGSETGAPGEQIKLKVNENSCSHCVRPHLSGRSAPAKQHGLINGRGTMQFLRRCCG